MQAVGSNIGSDPSYLKTIVSSKFKFEDVN